jgi:hypothetical protein
VTVFRVRCTDFAGGIEPADKHIGEPCANERERARFDTLPRPGLHVAQPFVFDYRAPFGIE